MFSTLSKKCEPLSSGKQLFLHENPGAIARDFLPHMSVLRHHFLPNVQFECFLISQGTLGGNFDIFAASGESTAWVLFWKTRSRPTGVTVCPVAQFKFFKTAFDPRKWTMVVFGIESLGRQPQLITPEKEWWYNTNYPSPPTTTFFLCSWSSLWSTRSTTSSAPWTSSDPRPPGSPGFPPGWPPAPSPAGGGERVETGNTSRERLHLLPRP